MSKHSGMTWKKTGLGHADGIGLVMSAGPDKVLLHGMLGAYCITNFETLERLPIPANSGSSFNMAWSPAFNLWFFVDDGGNVWTSPTALEGSWTSAGISPLGAPITLGIGKDGKPQLVRYYTSSTFGFRRCTDSPSTWTGAVTRSGFLTNPSMVGGSPHIDRDFINAPFPMSMSTTQNASGTTISAPAQPRAWLDVPWLGRTIFNAYEAFVTTPGAPATPVSIGTEVANNKSAHSESLGEVVSVGGGSPSTLTNDLVTFEVLPAEPDATNLLQYVVYWPPHDTFYATGNDTLGGQAALYGLDPYTPPDPGVECFWVDLTPNLTQLCDGAPDPDPDPDPEPGEFLVPDDDGVIDLLAQRFFYVGARNGDVPNKSVDGVARGAGGNTIFCALDYGTQTGFTPVFIQTVFTQFGNGEYWGDMSAYDMLDEFPTVAPGWVPTGIEVEVEVTNHGADDVTGGLSFFGYTSGWDDPFPPFQQSVSIPAGQSATLSGSRQGSQAGIGIEFALDCYSGAGSADVTYHVKTFKIQCSQG